MSESNKALFDKIHSVTQYQPISELEVHIAIQNNNKMNQFIIITSIVFGFFILWELNQSPSYMVTLLKAIPVILVILGSGFVMRKLSQSQFKPLNSNKLCYKAFLEINEEKYDLLNTLGSLDPLLQETYDRVKKARNGKILEVDFACMHSDELAVDLVKYFDRVEKSA